MTLPDPATSLPIRPASTPIRRLLLGAILGFVLVAFAFRAPIRHHLAYAAILRADAPSSAVVEELITDSTDPAEAIIDLWNTDRVIHRTVAIQQVGRVIPRGSPLPDAIEAILLSGALDPDASVREIAFSDLFARQHPALVALAVSQLQDPDPALRRLGLDHLRRLRATETVPAVVPLIRDPDPGIAALALVTLGRWANLDFGVKLADAIAHSDGDNAHLDSAALSTNGLERLRHGIRRAADWWSAEGPSFTRPLPVLPNAAFTARRPIPAPDFELRDLDGVPHRLSQYSGKTVLLNFWTTWCTACLAEIPALIRLRKTQGPELVILGISLDGLDDAHGHDHSHEHGHEEHDAAHRADQSASGHPVPDSSLATVRTKVDRFARRHGINYPLLLDIHNDAGGRFNGGELPTTVLIDSHGHLQRRFVGQRTFEVFEAMIREVAAPSDLGHSPGSTASPQPL